MSLVLLGILNSQASGAAGGAFELLETYTFSSDGYTATFTNLSTYSSDYKHLEIRLRLTNSSTSNYLQNVSFSLNGYTSGDYYTRHDFGNNGTGLTSEGIGGQYNYTLFEDVVPGSNYDQQGALIFRLADAFNSSKYPVIAGYGGGYTSNERAMHVFSGSLKAAEAVDELQVETTTGGFKLGTTISIYGIRG